MRDKATIIAGLVVFLVLATFPFWYAIVADEKLSPPDLVLPDPALPVFAGGQYHCVEDNMVARHMDLLDQWRNLVVRDGKRQYTSEAYGEQYEMSLTKTCMGCHVDGKTFCSRCHEYANVRPLLPLQKSATAQETQGAVGCWDCHLEQKEN